MQKFKDLRRLEAEEYFDLADMPPKQTGLPLVVFIMDKMESRHGVRLKVAPNLKWRRSQMLTVVLRPRIRVIDGELTPVEFALLSRWINLNRKTLIKYWDGEIDTLDAYEVLKPLRGRKPIKYRGRKMSTWEFLSLLTSKAESAADEHRLMPIAGSPRPAARQFPGVKPITPDALDSLEEPDFKYP